MRYKLISVLLMLMASHFSLASSLDRLIFEADYDLSKTNRNLKANFSNISTTKDGKGLILTKESNAKASIGPGTHSERAFVQYSDSDQEKIERVTFLKDTDRPDRAFWNIAGLKTASVVDGQVDSLTECEFHVHDSSTANQNKKDKSYIERLFSASDHERLAGSCHTVTKSICDGIKDKFSKDGLEKLSRTCSNFLEKLKEAVTIDYYGDEKKAQENINHLSSQYEQMHPTPVGYDRKFNHFFNNLARGERSDAVTTFKQTGRMLELCEDIDFHSQELPAKAETVSNTAVQD